MCLVSRSLGFLMTNSHRANGAEEGPSSVELGHQLVSQPWDNGEFADVCRASCLLGFRNAVTMVAKASGLAGDASPIAVDALSPPPRQPSAVISETSHCKSDLGPQKGAPLNTTTIPSSLSDIIRTSLPPLHLKTQLIHGLYKRIRMERQKSSTVLRYGAFSRGPRRQ